MMDNNVLLNVKGLAAMALTAALITAPATAHEVEGEHPPVEEELAISAAVGADYNTHFILYGYDIWAAGDDWDQGTFNPFAEFTVDFEAFTFTGGTWWDVNDNAESSIGGDLQEVDVYAIIGFDIDKFSFGIGYQEWYYASQTEEVFDVSVSYDDSELLGDFAMTPTFVAHKLMSGGDIPGVRDSGWAYVFSVEPGFTLIESETYPVDISFPAAVGFGDSDYYADSGYAWSTIGVAMAMPLHFIPNKYGDWTFGAALKYYHTDDEAIPVNPEDEFVTGTVGVAASF